MKFGSQERIVTWSLLLLGMRNRLYETASDNLCYLQSFRRVPIALFKFFWVSWHTHTNVLVTFPKVFRNWFQYLRFDFLHMMRRSLKCFWNFRFIYLLPVRKRLVSLSFHCFSFHTKKRVQCHKFCQSSRTYFRIPGLVARKQPDANIFVSGEQASFVYILQVWHDDYWIPFFFLISRT